MASTWLVALLLSVLCIAFGSVWGMRAWAPQWKPPWAISVALRLTLLLSAEVLVALTVWDVARWLLVAVS